MKKIISTSILCLIICVIPLIKKPVLLMDYTILVVVFFFYLLFFTQPTFKASDIHNKSDTDKYSMLFILLALIVILSGAIIDWAYIRIAKDSINEILIQTLGLFLLISGSTIRIWAILHLGKFFSNSVEFESEHKLIKTGPYKLIRHPSYLGAYLAIIGSALFLKSITFTLIGIVVMFLVYQYRIKIEEVGLTQIFPNDYEKYKKETKKIIPLIY